MKKQIFQHFFVYSLLLTFLAIFSYLFIIAGHNQLLQKTLILALGAFYLSWGSFVHIKAKTFDFEIFFEYLAVVFFAVVLLWINL